MNNNWVTNSNGVRARFLLRLAKANALKLVGKTEDGGGEGGRAGDMEGEQDYS